MAKDLREFGKQLGAAIAVREVTQAALADTVGATQSAVSQWKSGLIEPSPQTVFKLERALKLAPGQLSSHLGYLPLEARRDVHLSVESAIMADPLLTSRQRRGLLALYREFVS